MTSVLPVVSVHFSPFFHYPD